MRHRIRLHDSAGPSGGRGELVGQGPISPRNQGETALAGKRSSLSYPGKNALRRCGAALLLFVACAVFLCLGYVIVALDLRPVDFRPGIGDPEQAKIKIKNGMTRDEVRSLLGPPHGRDDDSQGAIYWTYRCDFFGGTLFRVHFGPDDRVTSSEWWLN